MRCRPLHQQMRTTSDIDCRYWLKKKFKLTSYMHAVKARKQRRPPPPPWPAVIWQYHNLTHCRFPPTAFLGRCLGSNRTCFKAGCFEAKGPGAVPLKGKYQSELWRAIVHSHGWATRGARLVVSPGWRWPSAGHWFDLTRQGNPLLLELPSDEYNEFEFATRRGWYAHLWKGDWMWRLVRAGPIENDVHWILKDRSRENPRERQRNKG